MIERRSGWVKVAEFPTQVEDMRVQRERLIVKVNGIWHIVDTKGRKRADARAGEKT